MAFRPILTSRLASRFRAAISSAIGRKATAAVQVTLNALLLSTTSATALTAFVSTVVGATAGSSLASTSSDGAKLKASGGALTGSFNVLGTATQTLTETLAGATGSPKQSNANITVAPYTGYTSRLGQVAKSHICDSSSANTQMNSRTAHIMRGGASALQVIWPLFYMANFTETAGSAAGSFRASIEYPSGTITQVTFGGNATKAFTAGQNQVVGDLMTLVQAIPDGAEFWLNVYMTTTAGRIPYLSLKRNEAAGERLSVATSGLTDKTGTGGTFTSSDTTGAVYPPTSILAQTTRPVFGLIGDSRVYGQGDTPDSALDIGEFQRSVGGAYGYASLGTGGDRAYSFVASHPIRLALINQIGATHILDDYGINDLRPDVGQTLAQLQANKLTIWGYFTTPKVYTSTAPPYCTDTAGQTPNSTDNLRVAYNAWLRAGAPIVSGAAVAPGTAGATVAGQSGHPLTGGVLDVDAVVANASSQWLSSTYTVDGIHESATGALLERAAGCIRVSIP